MKINSVFAKTALAAAIAGVSFAATAGTLTITNPSVVAVELFTGDPASDQTSITLPEIEFKAVNRTNNSFTAADNNTIKLTLAATHAVFASDFNKPSEWASQGVVIKVGANVLDNNNVVGVDAGTQGNNVIIVRVDDSIDLEQDVTIKGLKVWNLKQTHNVLSGTTSVNMELTGSLAGEFETTPNKEAIYTADGVTLAGQKTDYDHGASANRGYIEVDSAQTRFTDAITGFAGFNNPVVGASVDHRDAFDASAAVNKLYFGTLSIARGSVNVGGSNLEAGNEHGTKFQISGGDKLKLTLTSEGASLSNYGLGLYANNNCTGSKSSLAVSNNGQTAEVTLTDPVSLDAATPYHLCAVTNTNTALATLTDLSAAVSVEYTNVRYGKSSGNINYGKVLRNGCSVTLFNLPNVNAQDSAMIRFTNTSGLNQRGEVTASVWSEDGVKIDDNVVVLNNLDTHATAILHTNANLADTDNRVYLGDKLAGFGDSTGRSRIIIDGAFPSCEALGLVRSENGTLVNMTSTVYSGSENNTSNTQN